MANATTRRRRAGWWVAGCAALLAVLSLVVLLRPLPGGHPGRPAPAAVGPRVTIEPIGGPDGKGWLSDEATFFDPTPLFLPTEWNTNQGPLPAAVQRQPGQVFPDFDPKLTYGRAELALPIAPAEPTPRDPVDLLKAPSRDPFLGFGRADIPLTPLVARTAVVEIREVGSGKLVPVPNLAGDAVLPASQMEWQPAEFLVCVTAEGLLGRPVETVSSDVEDVDAFFRDYLAKTMRLGERLPPGMYRVVVGP
jgi:hypothetical protein